MTKRTPTIVGELAILHGPNGEWWIVDIDDLTLVGQYNWTEDKPNKYAICNARLDGTKRRCRLHALLMGFPEDRVIDHISGDARDNTRANLRICESNQNGCNLPVSKANTSGFKGVGWYKANKCWRAYIVRNDKQTHLGYFTHKEDAIEAYAQAERKFFGEFCRTESGLLNKQRS